MPLTLDADGRIPADPEVAGGYIPADPATAGLQPGQHIPADPASPDLAAIAAAINMEPKE